MAFLLFRVPTPTIPGNISRSESNIAKSAVCVLDDLSLLTPQKMKNQSGIKKATENIPTTLAISSYNCGIAVMNLKNKSVGLGINAST